MTVQQSHLQRVWTVERLRAILRPFPRPTPWTFSALLLPRPPLVRLADPSFVPDSYTRSVDTLALAAW